MTEQHKPKRKNPLWVLGAIAAFLVSQAKLIIPLLKFGKVGGAVISMFVSIGAYALIAPLPFAIGIVVMLLIHEMGHVLAAKMKGLPVSAPLFIPFLGALITMKKHPTDAVTEAFIGIGGPVLGTVGGVAAYALGLALHSPVLLSVAYLAFYLNLINLLPIHPLDGGRISTAVTRWLWLVGLIGGLAVIIYLKSILFFIIWATFAWDMYKKFVKYRNREQVLTVTSRFEYPAEHLLQQGYIIPGEEHSRELEFTTFSELDEAAAGSQTVVAWWQGIGFEGRMYLPKQALIKKVQVVRIDRLQKESGLHLGIHIQVSLTPLDLHDSYYDVPVKTRWKFGTAYIGLALFLLYMIRQVHQDGILG